MIQCKHTNSKYDKNVTYTFYVTSNGILNNYISSKTSKPFLFTCIGLHFADIEINREKITFYKQEVFFFYNRTNRISM